MRNLTRDEETYLSMLKKSRARGFVFAGFIFILFSGIALYNGWTEFSASITGGFFEWNLYSIAALPRTFLVTGLFCGGFILLGVLLLFSGLRRGGRYQVDKISGPYSCRMKERKKKYFIGDTRIVVPGAWMNSFEHYENYAIEVARETNTLFKMTPVLLRVEGMAMQEAGFSLVEMENEQRALLAIAWRSLFKFLVAVGVPFLLLLGFFYLLRTRSESVASLVNENSRLIFKFLDYLGTHPTAEAIFSFFFRNGFTIIVIIIVFLVFLTGGIKRGRGKDNGLPSKSWNSWLREYEAFMSGELKPMMMRDDRDTTILMDYRKVMEKQKEYQQEYKRYKKYLGGGEKNQFLRELKRIKAG